jgi:hypothetical protein
MTLSSPSSRLRQQGPVLTLVVLLLAGLLVSAPPSAAQSVRFAGPLGVPAQSSFDPLDNGDPVQVRTLSGRADLVSGGDALVEIAVPAGTDLETVVVTRDGNDITDGFRAGGPGLRGLVTGLPVGTSDLVATVPGTGTARLAITNAPQSGPVFSGPLIEPWTCRNGSDQADCSQEPEVRYWYRSTDPARGPLPGRSPTGPTRSGLHPYDPQNPPDDVATTTTDDGHEVPFIVREEIGYSLRDQYRIAGLWDPADGEPDPTADHPAFNGKLVLNHGFSCDTSYQSGTAPDVLFEDALSRGFAVGSHALDNAGHNCNLVTQAESLVMTKEMVVERFGPLRYTIGSGCSGGSLVQLQVANAYPGVYQAVTPGCTFTDAWSSAQQYVDYVGLREYLEDPSTFPEHRITPAQWPSVFGHANPANQITFTTAIANSGRPDRSCPGVPDDDVYDAEDNPEGVRCTLHDYMVNVFGVDDRGFARRPISNVGIQYGLSGLLAFLGENAGDPTRPPLTPDQFVALNANAGGYDIDFQRTRERTQADPLAQERVYRSGSVNTGAHLDQVAIIDLGGPEPGAFHDVYRKYSLRDRLIREHGTADNQVFWEGQVALFGDPNFVEESIDAADRWLAGVEADGRGVPLARKILDAREEAGVTQRCTDGAGQDLPLETCTATVDPTIFSSPRIEAGGGDEAPVNGVGPEVVGFTDDRLDCETMPIEAFVYAGQSFEDVFDSEQQEALRIAFPDGVCDYSRPGRGFQAAVPWLTYQEATGTVIHGGEPLGASPTSVFTAGGADSPAAGAPAASAGAPAVTPSRSLPATGGNALPGLAVLALGVAGLATRRRGSV